MMRRPCRPSSHQSSDLSDGCRSRLSPDRCMSCERDRSSPSGMQGVPPADTHFSDMVLTRLDKRYGSCIRFSLADHENGVGRTFRVNPPSDCRIPRFLSLYRHPHERSKKLRSPFYKKPGLTTVAGYGASWRTVVRTGISTRIISGQCSLYDPRESM
ncbi:hypothetical protein OH77DRAFT_963123 [Trametes cingulata]|nr:hypothetical protein OH77DRAFT_963123 [Trametes cingulata]